MSAPTFVPLAAAPQSGPIRSYPPTPDGSVPAGIAALGQPDFVHRFQSFAEQCHLGWLFGTSAHQHPTYISYERALAVVTPQAFTVIPWEEITEFLHPVGFKASNGQKYVLTNDFTDYFPIYTRLQNEILANVLPQALMAVEEGKEWIFEPFAPPSMGDSLAAALGQPQLAGQLGVSTAGIRYKDQRIAWDEVANIQVTNHLYNGALCSSTLSVRKNYGLFSAMQFDFRTLPNSFLLTELLPYVCPQRLLVPKQ